MVGTTLVLGGARSGKSRRAQHLAEEAGGKLVYIATAQAFDGEMEERIARHQADRDARWQTVEAPRELVAAIEAHDGEGKVLLVDCLTLWLSNLLLVEADLDAARSALCALVPGVRGRLIMVANEVGLSVVPDNALARRFRDAAGLLNQDLRAVCDTAEFVVAGYPIPLG